MKSSHDFSFIRAHQAALCLTGITLVGLLLRIYHLDFQGYFSEELFTVSNIEATYYQIATYPFTQPGMANPPLYYLLSKLCSDLLGGISLVSIRLPAAIFGTLCVPAIYALGKEYYSETTGLFAAVVIALSDRMVFYSQYGRTYSLVFLCFLFAAYCFLKLQRQPSPKWFILMIVSSGLCLWSHYYSVVPLLVFWTILIWQNKKAILPYLPALAPVSIAFIWYILEVARSYLAGSLSYQKTMFTISWTNNAIWVPYECWGYAGVVLVPPFLLYLLRAKDKTAWYFGLTVTVTYISTMLLTLVFDPSARYAVLIAPLIIVPAMIPVSQVIGRGKDLRQRAVLASGFVYIILIANLYPLIGWYTTVYHFVFI